MSNSGDGSRHVSDNVYDTSDVWSIMTKMENHF